eukprot:487574-Pyramimonas_sp.AAC.1
MCSSTGRGLTRSSPPHAQAVGWAAVALCPDTSRVLSVLCGTLHELCQNIDYAEHFAFYRGLQHACPGSILYTDPAFVRDGVRKRGERERCGSRSAWSELWRAVWTNIHDWGGPSQIYLVK